MYKVERISVANCTVGSPGHRPKPTVHSSLQYGDADAARTHCEDANSRQDTDRFGLLKVALACRGIYPLYAVEYVHRPLSKSTFVGLHWDRDEAKAAAQRYIDKYCQRDDHTTYIVQKIR